LVTITMAILTIFGFEGCSKPKIVENNRLGWRASLIGDIKEYNNYVKYTFNKIDNYQKHFQEMYNEKTTKKKEAKKKEHDDSFSYDDALFNNEYSF